MKKKGKFIVIEGTDGSGKGTQFQLLCDYFKKQRTPFAMLDFPQYGNPSAYFVEKYLTGGYGAANDVNPRAASLFYAIDRFEVKTKLEKWLHEGRLVLANRYVASNMGHQGAKFKDSQKRRVFIRWVHDLEYGILEVPKPDLNIFLQVPPRIAILLIQKKSARAYLKDKKDIHENIAHIRAATRSYEDTIKLFPREFQVIECAPKGVLRSVPEIQQDVLELVKHHVGSSRHSR